MRRAESTTQDQADGHPPSASTLVALMAGAWALASAGYASFLHEVFRSTALDMALHSQLLWNLAHGRFMATSFLNHSFAASHVWPGLYLLAPVHAFFGVHGMLALQSLLIAAGAFAACSLARDITESESWGLAFALAYLLQPTLSIGVTFDYHPELLSVPFAHFALLGLRRRRVWFWPCLVLAVSFYEVVATVFVFLGAGLLLVRGRRRDGVLIVLFCLAWIGAILFAVMPDFRGGGVIPHWERYAHLGDFPAGALSNALRHPIRSMAEGVAFQEVAKLRYLLVAFGLLPLLGLKHLLPALPLLAVLILGNLDITSDIRYGYVAPALPFLLLSAAHGAARLRRAGRPRVDAIGPWILAACAILLFAYYQVKRPLRGHPFRIRTNLATLRTVREMIPPDAGLSADNHLGAHFAERELLLVTPATRRGGRVVDYILTDLRETEFKDAAWWASMSSALTNGAHGLVFFSDDVLLMQKGATNAAAIRPALNRIDAQALAARETEARRRQ